MRIIELDKQKECMSWGIQGESGATTLVVDINDFNAAASNGKPVVIFQRQDGHPYIHNFSTDGKNLFITLSQTDTQIIGKCEVSISWAVGQRIIKKKNYRSFILPSALEEDVPRTEEAIAALDDLQSYVEKAKELVANAQQFAAELIFVDTVPEQGDATKLYIENTTSQLYRWNGSTFVPMTSKPQYDVIFGGIADAKYDELLQGGDATFE